MFTAEALKLFINESSKVKFLPAFQPYMREIVCADICVKALINMLVTGLLYEGETR